MADVTLTTRTFESIDDANAACYSDHAEDIRTRGGCDFCGSADPLVVGPVLPHVPRMEGTDCVTAARTVLEEQSARIVDGVLLDLQTAHAIVTVYGALSTPAAQAKLRAMPVGKAGVVVWKIIDKHRSS